MNWKNWPYWVKGGVLGGIIYGTVLFGLSKTMATLSWVMPIPPWMDFVTQPFIYVVTFVTLSLRIIGININLQNDVAGIALWYTCMFLSGFLVGMVIGWLYGKFKNRNKSPSSTL